MSNQNPTIVARAEKAAEILQVKTEEVLKVLASMGIDATDFGLKLLNASTTDKGDILCVLTAGKSDSLFLKEKAAACILKGIDPFEEEKKSEVTVAAPTETSSNTIQTIVETLQQNRPLSQWKDRELLESFDKDRDPEKEQELHRRAKCEPFVILKKNGVTSPGKEPIDIEESLDLLKAARRGRKNPTIFPIGEVVKNVYKITELNIDDRMTELCPICGEALYKGYCTKCELSFAGMDDDVRAYLYLIAKAEKFDADSFSDRRAVWVSALKGLDDLRKTWPSLSKTFDEMKLTNQLPRLRILQSLPLSQKADPFHMFGNRSY